MATAHELEQEIRARPSAVMVVNTWSRRGERLYRRALAELQQRGMTIIASYPVRDPSRLPEVVHEIIEHGQSLVIVGGGDGTISSVVDDFAYRDVVLGLLPLGTGNRFARSLGIPLSLSGAVDTIIHGAVMSIDLGAADGDYFANVATLGMSAAMARHTSRRLKRYLGRLAYVLVGAKVMWNHHAFTCHLRVNGHEETLRTHEVVIAHQPWLGREEQRNLTVFVTETYTRWQRARGWLAFLRHQQPLRGVRQFSAREIWIETEPPQYINLDGETTMQTPAHFTIAPQALHILTPRIL